MLPEILSLDAGGTLIFPHPSVGDVYGEVLDSHGVSIPSDTLNQRFGSAFREAQALKANGIFPFSLEFWRRIVLRVIQPEVSQPRLQEAIFQEAFARFGRGSSWRLAKEIQPVLKALHRQGVPLVVFSNNDGRLKQVLKDLEVAHFFQHIFASTELGFQKPDPQAFQAVQTILQANPQQLLHIGDSLENDGYAPRRVGWKSLLAPGTADPQGQIPTLATWQDLLANKLVPNSIPE